MEKNNRIEERSNKEREDFLSITITTNGKNEADIYNDERTTTTTTAAATTTTKNYNKEDKDEEETSLSQKVTHSAEIFNTIDTSSATTTTTAAAAATTPPATTSLLDAADPQPNSIKQDYRLDFTEVESALEPVPETQVMTNPVNNPESPPAKVTSAGATTMVTAATMTADKELMTDLSAEFHIPESNASDIYSECSFMSNSQNFIRSSCEPLTAKQQVALWLTKTSMSDLSSMPSLRSLVFPGSGGGGGGGGGAKAPSKSLSKSSKAGQNQGGKKVVKNKAEIHRNFSTKSLINGYGCENSSRDLRDMMTTPSPIRKCETVMALSGLNHTHHHHHHHSHLTANQRAASTKKSSTSLSLFKRLSNNKVPRVAKKASTTTSSVRYHNHRLTLGSNDFCDSPSFRGIRPVNRLRSTCGSSTMMCSRCTSFLNSRATSQMSLMRANASQITMQDPQQDLCKICLDNTPVKEMVTLDKCGCLFCKECMNQYVGFEVMQGAYDIACPDAECDKQGVLQQAEIEAIVGKEMSDKHKTFRLNTEVALDKNRAWCPRPDCGTICHVCEGSIGPQPVSCPSCDKEFCSLCSSNWHQGKTCAQNGQDLVQRSLDGSSALPVNDTMINFDKFDGDIKPCPMCRVPIERDAGCAQMMCKRCKHVFCWFCLTSLDDDFLLRHYDSGNCKGMLGHSRASVLWHRAQVVGIFAGFGILLLVASPLLLLAAPCILCCRCKALEKFPGSQHRGSNARSSTPRGIEDDVGDEDEDLGVQMLASPTH